MTVDGKRASRRAAYAQATRAGILAAARRLYAERGYFATKVEDIAEEAAVAPATVYATTGGKQAMLSELIGEWASDPLVESSQNEVRNSGSAAEMLAVVAATTRRMREKSADVIRVMLNTAPHDEAIAAVSRESTRIYRDAFAFIAQRMIAAGGVTSDDPAYIADVLWFYFGYVGLFTLHDDTGWSFERATEWLLEQAARELLSAHGRA